MFALFVYCLLVYLLLVAKFWLHRLRLHARGAFVPDGQSQKWRWSGRLDLYLYIYIYIHIYVYLFIFIYMFSWVKHVMCVARHYTYIFYFFLSFNICVRGSSWRCFCINKIYHIQYYSLFYKQASVFMSFITKTWNYYIYWLKTMHVNTCIERALASTKVLRNTNCPGSNTFLKKCCSKEGFLCRHTFSI
jgi:hypothetical protein